jgi:excisionase family DNA binding protein
MTQQNKASVKGERMLSVRETAEIMGWCLDSVRRKLRSGELPGVRLGRNWRVSESQLASYIGVDNIGTSGDRASEVSVVSEPRSTAQHKRVSLPVEDEMDTEVVDALLRTAPARGQVLELVRKALVNSDVSPRRARQTLEELADLLRTI